MATKVGAKLLASLYTFTDGVISALDTFGPYVFCGLESGIIHKLRVVRDEDGTITTVLMLTANAGNKKHKIKRLVHSDVDPILFVLCRKRLFILSSEDFTPLREVAYDVSAFTVTVSDVTLSALQAQAQALAAANNASSPNSPESMKSARGAAPTAAAAAPAVATPRTLRTARSTSSRILPSFVGGGQTADPSAVEDVAANESNAEAAAGRPIHRICCCLRDERRVVVFEYIWTPSQPKMSSPPSAPTASPLSPRGGSKSQQQAPSAEKAGGATNSVLLNLDAEEATPGAVFAAARFGVLTRHAKEFLFPERISTAVEYNGVLCVGMLREYSVISLIDGDAKSLLALNGEEPGMALHDGNAYLRLNNVLFVTPVKGLPQMTKEALRMPRTILLEHRPVCFTLRHGIALGFSKECCEVYSLYDEDVVQRLPVDDGRCVSDRTFEDMIVCASKKQIWLVVLHELRTRMLDLVRRYKLGDAADLVMRCRQPSLEPELKVASAYMHLRHGAAFEAMAFFSVLIDVRQVLRYVPGVRPPCLVADAARRAELVKPMQLVHGASFDESVFSAFLQTAHPDLASALVPPDDSAEVDFWLRWSAFDVHDPELTTLDAAWTQSFDRVGEASATLNSSNRVVNGIEMNVAQFIAHSHAEVRHHLSEWLRTRLHDVDTATTPQRRAAEFALLWILLESGDAAGVYELIGTAQALEVRDAAAVLVSRGQFRALCLLLQRRGLHEAALTVYHHHMDLSVNLSSTSKGGNALCGSAGALGAKGEHIASMSGDGARPTMAGCFHSDAPFTYRYHAHHSPHHASPVTASTPDITVSRDDNTTALSNTSTQSELSFTHELFFAVESGNVSHVATVVRREGAAILRRCDHTGATALHVALATPWLGPTPPPPCNKLLAIVSYLASRGSDINATLKTNGLRAGVVPYTTLQRQATTRNEQGLSTAEKSLLIGSLLCGAASGFVLPP